MRRPVRRPPSRATTAAISSSVWRLPFINISARLSGGAADIVIADWLGEADEGKWRNIAQHDIADIVPPPALLSWLEDRFSDIHAVVHMGAISSTTETDADYMLRNNYQYTKDLAEFAVANDIRFIYASSAATYGDGSAGMDDGTETLNHLRPLNVYGYSKHLFDQYAARNEMFEHVVGLKYFNVFGPRQDPNSPYSAVIPLFVAALLSGKQPTIFGDGTQSRDFTYIDNVVTANLRAAEAPGVSGRVFNVACGSSLSVLDLLKEICRLLDKPFAPKFAPPRTGDVLHSWADISAAQRDLGYQVEVDLHEGLKRTVAYYAEQYERSAGATAARK